MRLIILSITFLFVSCSGPKSTANTIEYVKTPYEVGFVKAQSLSVVLDKAKRENKLVYVDIGAKWCLPCQMMKEDVYTDKGIGEYLNANFVSYLVDADEDNGKDLAYIFKAKSLPTILFLDTKGRVLERKSGAVYHREIRSMGDSALAKSGPRL